jgi:1-acyl-sn-glycerol-3-phosphate acyltransferase
VKHHERMVTLLIKGILSILCRVEASEMKRIPRRGPLIVMINHINFLEVPLLYTYIYPRPQSSLIKEETWNNGFLGMLARMWDAIPIRRGTSDFAAFRSADKELKKGRLMLMAPEGTRTGDGRLRKAKTGIVTLAAHGDYPIIPVVHYGGESFWRKLRRGHRTPFTFRVGPVVRLKVSMRRLSPKSRQEATDELMSLAASLLPRPYRGYYADKIPKEYSYLVFPESGEAG